MSEQSVQSRGGAKVAWAASVAGAVALASAAEAQQAVEVTQPASVVNGNLVIETATGPISIPAGSFTQVGNTFFINAATFAELSLLAQQAITGFGGAMASVGVVAAGGAGVFAAINFFGDDEVEISGSVLDTGSSSSDGVTKSNTISVSVSGGASWEFSTDGGQTWQTGSGDSFAVPDGTYAAGALQVRSANDDGSFVTSTVNASPVTVDTTAPSFSTAPASTTVAEDATGTLVSVAASDVVSGTVTYSLDAASVAAGFVIDASGNITNTGGLDYETNTSHTIAVTATDTAGNTTTATLGLTVTDVDDTGPAFTSTAYTTTVAEDATGTLATVSASDPSTPVTYALDAASVAAGFAVDASGNITNTGGLDYETSTSHSITVTATDSLGNTSTATVTLTVTDVDDTGPAFTSTAYTTTVAEDATGTLATVSASDPSTPVTYALDAASVTAGFTIDASGNITNTGGLDYETSTSHSITVTATDSLGNASTATVTLTVTDIDEIAPVFTSTAYTATVAEDATGTLATVSASDPSTPVTYALDAASVTAGFAVDASGNITNTGGLDYETSTSHSMTVTATDAAGNASTATVTLTVTDIDEIAPVFTSTAYTATVAEDATGTLATVSASDPSTPVTYALDAASVTAGFTIDASGNITNTGGLDYETSTSHSITVTATDSLGNASTATVTLTVTDIDDTAPAFTSTAYTATVAEDATGTLATVSASDPSTPVTYALDAASVTAGFTIDASGNITNTGGLDFETSTSHSITVTATDSLGNASTATVTLTVTDIDDTAPAFTSTAYTATVAEDASGTLATVSASDPSTPVTYALDAASVTAGFAIDASGNITNTGGLDFETSTSHSITVTATDSLGNASTATVTLTVTDIDEIAPVFTSSAYTATVAENVVGTLATVSASDPSTPVTYALDAASVTAGFTIDASGNITNAGGLDYETSTSHSITVTATDAAGNASTATVTLTVTDADEVAPTFTSTAYTATVAEDATGTLATVSASDPSTPVTYALDAASVTAGFTIDASGNITNTGGLDYETSTSHSITVTATDAAGNASTATVTLTVTDIDEIAPVFTSTAYTATVAEDATGTLATVSASDPSTPVTYALDAASVTAGFTIDASGNITNAGGLDYETSTSHSMTVTATDAAGNASTATVTLTVTDIDEVAPVFTSTAYTATVAEDATGTLATVSASDNSGSFSYALDAASVAAGFAVDASGNITNTGGLDYETSTSHSITVTATDAAGNASTATMTLTVTDIDEVAPVFTSTAYTATVAEDATGTLATVSASDNSGSFSYALDAASVTAGFAVDASGNITNTGGLDYETSTSHSITVTATDAAGNASTATMTLTVTDVVEVTPTITANASYDVTENTTGTLVAATIANADNVTLTGDDAGLFSIDASGNITANTAKMDFEDLDDNGANGVYNLTISASIGGGTPVTHDLVINLKDVTEVTIAGTQSASTADTTALLTDDGTSYTWGGAANSTNNNVTLNYGYNVTGALSMTTGNNSGTPEIMGADKIQTFSNDATTFIDTIFADIASFAGVTFNKVTIDSNSNHSDVDILIGMSTAADAGASDSTLAFAWQPWTNDPKADAWGNYAGGDLVILSDTVGATDFTDSWAEVQSTVTHELGHGLGLDHPFVDGTGNGFGPYDDASANWSQRTAGADNPTESIMTYYRPWYTNVTGADGNRIEVDEVQPTYFGIEDILALQTLYGVNMTVATGDDTYTFNASSPTFETIWDAGGYDTIVHVGSNDAYINLNAGEMSRVGDVPMATFKITVANLFNGYYDLSGVYYGTTQPTGVTTFFRDFSTDIFTSFTLADAHDGTVVINNGVAEITPNLVGTYDGSVVVTVQTAAGINVTFDLAAAVRLNPDPDGDNFLDETSFNVGIAHGVTIEAATGDSGNDTIIGNDAANTITGNGGDDLLAGGKGGDVFVYAAGDGADTIALYDMLAHVASSSDPIANHYTADFTKGEDVIQFAAALNGSQTVTEASGNTVIDFGSGNSVTVFGVTGLTEGVDYIFA